MTAIDLHAAPPPAPALRAAWRDCAAREPVYAAAAILLALSMIPTLGAHAIDPRTIGGEAAWLKPLKFQFALATYLATLAAVSLARPAVPRRPRAYRAWTWVVVGCVAYETVWIAGAAHLGTSSHFNVASPVGSALYTAAGIAAVTLTAASAVTAAMIARGGVVRGALRDGLVLGLGLTFAATVIVAGTLSAQPGHFVGIPATGARVPLLGWSREVGDLRVAHFLATHALHAVPLAALAALWLAPARARLLTWTVAAIWAALIAATFAQALAGRPVLPL